MYFCVKVFIIVFVIKTKIKSFIDLYTSFAKGPGESLKKKKFNGALEEDGIIMSHDDF